MPKVNPRALLEIDEVRRAMAVATETGPYEAALFAWMYEFGARAAEPGLQRIDDVDLRAARARPVHLKHGKITKGAARGVEWDALLPFCRRALPVYLEQHATFRAVNEQGTWLFPARKPGTCDACKGTGRRPALEKRAHVLAHCHHCGGDGRRLGASRHDVYHIVVDILTRAGVPKGHRHPHTLRHSIITHLLEGGMSPGVIQERVGHRWLTTTLGYVRATQAARAKLEGALSSLYTDPPETPK